MSNWTIFLICAGMYVALFVLLPILGRIDYFPTEEEKEEQRRYKSDKKKQKQDKRELKEYVRGKGIMKERFPDILTPLNILYDGAFRLLDNMDDKTAMGFTGEWEAFECVVGVFQETIDSIRIDIHLFKGKKSKYDSVTLTSGSGPADTAISGKEIAEAIQDLTEKLEAEFMAEC